MNQDTNSYYIVQSGDSYWGISQKFGISIDELLKLINLSADHMLHPGDRLIVKKGSTTINPGGNGNNSGSVKTYTVVSGDSLWGIANKFGLTLDELCSLNGLTISSIIHPGDVLIVSKNDGTQPTPTPSPKQNNLDAVVQWFMDRIGKVTYSMNHRTGPTSYDCSSAVYSALIAGGFLPQGSWLGNTETLYQQEGSLLIPISRSQARYGDIFVAGVKGGSLNEYGHTGVFISNDRIIHCNYGSNGIAITPLEGYYGNGPLHCYRLRGAENNTPTPQPIPPTGNETLVKSYSESARFTANQEVNIYNNYQKNSPVAASLSAGESVYYDSVYITNKHVWISYISYSGTRRYVPIRAYNNGVVGPMVGSIS
ncbi:peptidoglycan amidohydrolase family protein [Facklamia sp. P12934]|uniref:peptidoglycan amidohydrolase family protein n=1 Tax=unclassified Facklamia TaxID=2622293 RepID=UPI003D17EB96